MFGQLEDVEKRFNEIRAQMARPDVAANHDRFRELTMAYRGLEEIVNTYRDYQQIATDLEEAGEIIRDSNDMELVEIAREEQVELQQDEARLAEKLRFLLIPRDPNDGKNTIVEIRAGAGGEEAALFAADLYRMYTRYSESKGWRAELLSANPTGIGGFKEVIFSVGGSDVYGNLKYESGVHRVQRIPEDRIQWAHPHVHFHGCGPARSGRSRRRNQSRGNSCRRLPFLGAGRSERKYDRFGRSDYPFAHRPDRAMPGREVPTQEQGQSDEGPPCPAS